MKATAHEKEIPQQMVFPLQRNELCVISTSTVVFVFVELGDKQPGFLLTMRFHCLKAGSRVAGTALLFLPTTFPANSL